MRPNKEWMSFFNDRLNEKYKVGVEEFLDFAFENSSENKIRCPCTKCCNTHSQTREVAKMHLFVHGILPGYTLWYHHGERCNYTHESDDDNESEQSEGLEEVEEILRDLYPGMDCFDGNEVDVGASSQFEHREEPNDDAKKFYRLLKHSKQPVYPGCATSKLSALVELLHIKSIGRWSNESFDMLLQMLKKLLPRGSTLPESYYDSKKIVKDLGLSYVKIDACVNDCMLYWKEEEASNECKICGVSRWKDGNHNGETKIRTNGKKKPKKILRYFPLKPRLQRLFMSTKTASSMRWHHEGRKDDGAMIHPADSKAWKSFDELHKEFSSEPRNVRLGLASDGFQPFKHSKTSYSIWPVILIPYNVPPWMCMKQSNFILSMLIPGPTGPGDAIDVYLRPLIEELKELWEVGVDTFDASTQQNFKLHASLLWTINDFPAYANLSGWSTKGKLACPCCKKDTCSIWLANGKKHSYIGHRCHLDVKHNWRNDTSSFDGTKETRLPPKFVSGADVLLQVNDLEGIPLTKAAGKKVKISHAKRGDNWNKKSIFFELLYWSTNLLPHNLDVMHIEKNVCDNILGTIMNLKGKTKDNSAARLDMEAMNIRPELHLIRTSGKADHMPDACYTLRPKEKHLLCLFLKQLKVPDGFSSNVSQCVDMKDHKISGLKSHDCHVLLQHLLPLAIRGLLYKEVCEPLIELSMYFSSLGAKSLRVEELEKLETQIPITLCKLEKVFPPSFFDVMVHLPIHLATEAKIGGPVQYRWMYSIERSMYEMKQFIRNMAHPEGSIAEGYIAKECMTLCSRYLKDMKTEFNKLERNYDGGSHVKGKESLFSEYGRALGFGSNRDLNAEEWDQAHDYVLNNCSIVQPFLKEYSEIHQHNPLEKDNVERNKGFLSWFKKRVLSMCKEDNSEKMEVLLSLSRGPSKHVTCFKGYVINGYRFRIEDCDKGCRTQNSGVCVTADIGSGIDNIDYFGVLTEIIELQYLGGRRLSLFRCRWFDVHDKEKGAKIDAYGFTTINCNRLLKTNEPFILASQASQVFYANDNMNKGWNVVIKTTPRDAYELPSTKEDERDVMEDLDGAYQHGESFRTDSEKHVSKDGNNAETQPRSPLQPTLFEVSSLKRKRK